MNKQRRKINDKIIAFFKKKKTCIEEHCKMIKNILLPSIVRKKKLVLSERPLAVSDSVEHEL